MLGGTCSNFSAPFEIVLSGASLYGMKQTPNDADRMPQAPMSAVMLLL